MFSSVHACVVILMYDVLTMQLVGAYGDMVEDIIDSIKIGDLDKVASTVASIMTYLNSEDSDMEKYINNLGKFLDTLKYNHILIFKLVVLAPCSFIYLQQWQ